jgi:uncharacterized protein DUF2845
MKTLIFLIGVAALLLCGSESFASMSCGGRWINNRMSKLDVVSICGRPDLTEFVAWQTVAEHVGRTSSASTTPLEAWHYNCGPGRFNKTLYFGGGKLLGIKVGDTYGSGQQKCD